MIEKDATAAVRQAMPLCETLGIRADEYSGDEGRTSYSEYHDHASELISPIAIHACCRLPEPETAQVQ